MHFKQKEYGNFDQNTKYPRICDTDNIEKYVEKKLHIKIKNKWKKIK
jgi:hypothetical protein